jgi:hypothetical protein
LHLQKLSPYAVQLRRVTGLLAQGLLDSIQISAAQGIVATKKSLFLAPARLVQHTVMAVQGSLRARAPCGQGHLQMRAAAVGPNRLA